MPDYEVVLELPSGPTEPKERITHDDETIRDLLIDISKKYSVDILEFALEFDGQPSPNSKKSAPFDATFLNRTVNDVLNNEEDEEPNYIVLTVKKYDADKKARIVELKQKVKEAEAVLEAAKAALKTQLTANLSGGKRRTKRNS